LTLSSLFAPGLAHANCPGAFEDKVCDPLGTDICTYTGSGTSTTLECSVAGAGSASTIIAVSDFETGDDEVEVWGDYGGTVFCCDMDMNNTYNVTLYGSDYGDTLQFTYDSNANNLAPIATYSPGDMIGTIYGGDGADTIRGSNVGAGGSYDFDEFLYGEDQPDHIYGNGAADYISGGGYRDFLYGGIGADTIDGDLGDDTINGGLGGDTISGGAGDDIILGDAGDDTIDGDGGEDQISGGDDNDTIDGGGDADVICGDSGDEDTISDGDLVAESSPDQIWDEDASTSTLICADSSTNWGASTTTDVTGCISANKIVARPTDCP